MKLFILIFLILSTNLYANSKSGLYSDVYLEHFNSKLELPWGDDAFLVRPGIILSEPEPDEILPVLSAVITDPTNPMAILDGKAVKIGSLVRNRKVLEIGPSYVLLERGASVVGVVIGEPRRFILSDKPKEVQAATAEGGISIPGQIGQILNSSLTSGIGSLLK